MNKPSDQERQLVKDFKKSELIKVAKDLGFEKIPEMTSLQWVKQLNDDLDLNGVPEWKDCSDVMVEYLVAAGYYDGDGNLLDETKEVVDKSTDKTSVVEGGDALRVVPACFGFYDVDDPACATKCTVTEICIQRQTNTRPECFGVLFEEHNQDCAGCIIAFMCVKAMVK